MTEVPDLPLRLTERMTLAMARAAKLAVELNAKAIGTEHVLLALLTDPQGAAVTALKDAGVTVDMLKLKQAVRAIHGFGTGLASPENLERWRKAREAQMVRTSDPKIVQETSKLLPKTPTIDQIRAWREDALLVVSTRPSEEVLRKLVTSVFDVLEHVTPVDADYDKKQPGETPVSTSAFPGNVRAVSPGENPEMDLPRRSPIRILSARELAEIVSKDHSAVRCDSSAIHDIRALLLMMFRCESTGDVSWEDRFEAAQKEIEHVNQQRDQLLRDIDKLRTCLMSVHAWFTTDAPAHRTAGSLHREVRTALGLP